MKGSEKLEYYAATLRAPGEKLNNDGLMVKGIRQEKRSDMVVMVISAHKTAPKLNYKVIKMAEKIVCKFYDANIEDSLKKLFVKYCRGGFWRRKPVPDITVLVLKGINYYVINRGKNRVVRVGRCATDEILCDKMSDNKVNYCYTSGRLSEGSTLVVGTESFFERQLFSEIHKRLCPQMCVNDDVMQDNIDDIRELLFSRGEERTITAAALCIK